MKKYPGIEERPEELQQVVSPKRVKRSYRCRHEHGQNGTRYQGHRRIAYDEVEDGLETHCFHRQPVTIYKLKRYFVDEERGY
ncbi:MAG: hypothetical protein ACE5IF_03985 [Candidatus Bathyarchaeia archaeon]